MGGRETWRVGELALCGVALGLWWPVLGLLFFLDLCNTTCCGMFLVEGLVEFPVEGSTLSLGSS